MGLGSLMKSNSLTLKTIIKNAEYDRFEMPNGITVFSNVQVKSESSRTPDIVLELKQPINIIFAYDPPN